MRKQHQILNTTQLECDTRDQTEDLSGQQKGHAQLQSLFWWGHEGESAEASLAADLHPALHPNWGVLGPMGMCQLSLLSCC